jgi:L-rhamnose-H+ transport protein
MLGLMLVSAAGILNGTYALPMKRTRRWAFENTWLVYSVVSMLVLNGAVSLSTVPDLAQVYARAGAAAVSMAFAFGVLWGLGNVLFGMGIVMIGISLTFPITIGLSTALGSLIPMARHPAIFLTPGGATITLGIAVLLAGVAVCAIAGIRKDAQARGRVENGAGMGPTASRGLTKGLIIVTLSGLCDPFLNFAFSFGVAIKQEASAAGATAGAEADAVWTPVLLGSLVVNAAWCTVLLIRNGSWTRFREKGTAGYWFLAALMGAIWILSITLYGRGASMMGPLGDSVGWAVFYGCIIIFSALWGIIAGEWREGKGRPLRTLYAGLAILMFAIVILGYGDSLPTR